MLTLHWSVQLNLNTYMTIKQTELKAWKDICETKKDKVIEAIPQVPEGKTRMGRV